jgi:hypothetical protein
MLRSYQRISPGPRHFETFRNNRKIFTVRGCRPHAQPPSWRTTSCRLSATAYSIYSQLPSVPGGLPSIRNLRTRHAVVTRNPPNMETEQTLKLLHPTRTRSHYELDKGSSENCHRGKVYCHVQCQDVPGRFVNTRTETEVADRNKAWKVSSELQG